MQQLAGLVQMHKKELLVPLVVAIRSRRTGVTDGCKEAREHTLVHDAVYQGTCVNMSSPPAGVLVAQSVQV